MESGDVDWDVNGTGSGNGLRIQVNAADMSLFAGTGSPWMANGGYQLAAMATTAMVSSGANFANGGYISQNGNIGGNVDGFSSVAASFVGFRFEIDDGIENGDDTHYGWVEMTPTFGVGNSIEFHRWAYNSIAGEAIQIGQTSAVPEPATAATGLGLLALGAAGLRRQRWLKRKAA